MANITISIPEDLKKEMDELGFVNWSAMIREVIRKRISLLKKLKEFTMDSEITEEDALRWGREVNRNLHKRYEAMRKKK